MPRGIGRNEVARKTGLKGEVVDRNLQRLRKDGFIVVSERGKGRWSPYFISPGLYLDLDEFERKCDAAGLFRPEYGYAFENHQASERRLRILRRKPTVGKVLQTIEKTANFLIGQKESKGRGSSPAPRAFSQESISWSILKRIDLGLILLLINWVGSILLERPMNVYQIQTVASLGGKPLRGNIARAILVFLRDNGLVSERDGIWMLTRNGTQRFGKDQYWVPISFLAEDQ